MDVTENTVKSALKAGMVQHGFWLASASTVVTEISGAAGFDWCLIDCEHGPGALAEISPQLYALASTGTPAVVRVPCAEVWMIKQTLDLGVQTVVVPMVDDAETALRMAQAMRYPSAGIRGMGAVVARASGYSANADYVHQANAEVCLFVQAESAKAVDNIDSIATTSGVDGVFIGPSDLSADMGYPGQPAHPEVLKAIDHLTERTKAAGKFVGTISTDESKFAALEAAGMTFIGVGVDTMILQSELSGLAARIKAS